MAVARVEIANRLATKREAESPQPAPIYDDVFAAGVAALDGFDLIADPSSSRADEPRTSFYEDDPTQADWRVRQAEIAALPYPTSLKPLVKWIGGKRKLLPQILPLLPAFTGTYWEPMCGGASLFGALLPKKAVLADINPHVINLYRQVQWKPDDLTYWMKKNREMYQDMTPEQRSSWYYAARERWNKSDRAGKWNPEGEEAATAFLFLKATAFNGLWRENKKGEMNAPWGKYTRIALPSAKQLIEWHKALKDVDIRLGDVTKTCEPKPGDLVYLDPPYVGTFTAYNFGGFTEADQGRLLTKVAGWVASGVHVAYSNSLGAERLLDAIWPTGTRHRVTTRYAVNSHGAGRKPVEELLVVE